MRWVLWFKSTGKPSDGPDWKARVGATKAKAQVRRPEMVDVIDDDGKCRLCGVKATSAHLISRQHVMRQMEMEE